VSIVEVGIAPYFPCAAYYAASKNHRRGILRNKNHLYAIILVYLILNTALKSRNHLLVTGYRFLKNCQHLKFCLTHCLTDHSRKPRAQTKQRMATILCHNNKLTNGMCLLGFRKVRGLCTSLFLLGSSSCSKAMLMLYCP